MRKSGLWLRGREALLRESASVKRGAEVRRRLPP